MKLERELKLRRGFESAAHEVLLNLYHTAARLRKCSGALFTQHGLTDVQFNVLMLLEMQRDDRPGLTQVELSRMMLVNRANVTTLIDRMERGGLVKRVSVSGDRRCNEIVLTVRGTKLLHATRDEYTRHVERLMAPLSDAEQHQLIDMLERVRQNLGGAKTTEKS